MQSMAKWCAPAISPYMGQRPLLVGNASLIRASAASRQVQSSIRSGICLGSCLMIGWSVLCARRSSRKNVLNYGSRCSVKTGANYFHSSK